jgi:hypothetical protein
MLLKYPQIITEIAFIVAAGMIYPALNPVKDTCHFSVRIRHVISQTER